MFRISHEPIAPRSDVGSEADGGFVVFVGKVRSTNQGQPVLRLEYESYEELAVTTGCEVMAEALERFDISAASCVHRVGTLELGDTAIVVEVAAAHRAEAFEACQYIVNEIKSRVPIWKKEHYETGTTEWINCQTSGASESDYYARQTILSEVGESGQEKLRSAKVLVVGAGGLGSSALMALAGAGVGTIGICEHDRLEISNLHRQPIYEFAAIGRSKAVLAAQRIQTLNPFIKVVKHVERISEQNSQELISKYDIVLDCTDNFETKFLLNDMCRQLGKTLIQASIYQHEGQLMIVKPTGPCLRCLWPQVPDHNGLQDCEEAGVLGTVPAIFGTLQASEAIKQIVGIASPIAAGKMLIFNLRDYSSQQIAIPQNPECPACKGMVERDEIFVTQIGPGDLVIDIRAEHEREAKPLTFEAVQVDQNAVAKALQPEQRAVIICRIGVSSARTVRRLRLQGHKNVFALQDGAMSL